MIVALWRGSNRCRAAVSVQSLWRRPAGILRYRLMGRDLLRDRALRLPFRQRRHRRHRRTRGAGRDRRLGLLVAAAEADIGEALQERHPGLLRMLLLRITASLPD